MTSLSPQFLFNTLRSTYAFSTNTLNFLTQMGQQDISRFNVGPYRMCLLNRPDLIEAIFQHDRSLFIKPKLVTKLGAPIFGSALTALDEDVWLTRRQQIMPAFSTKKIDSYMNISSQCINHCVASLPAGIHHDVESYFRRLFICCYARIFMDIDIDSQANRRAGAIEKAMKADGTVLQLGAPIPEWLPTPVQKNIQASMQLIRTIFAEQLNARITLPFSSPNLLSVLLPLYNAGQLSLDQLIDELMIMICVGAHQSALSITWILQLCATHSHYQTLIASEAEALTEPAQAYTQSQEKLPLTAACVSEGLRLFPPFFVIGREAKQDCIVLGESFKRGDNLLVSAWVTQRDSRYFEQPEQFMPERFSGSNKIARSTYFPLGLGARTCVAQLLLKHLLPIVTAKYVQRFRFQLAPQCVVKPTPRLTLGFKNTVGFEARLR